jgi:hypothetical protein
VLEDPSRRIKERIQDLGTGATEPGWFNASFPYGFDLSKEDHFVKLKKVIEESGADVIILDTYQRATPGLLSGDDKQQSPIIHMLSHYTRQSKKTLIIIDHLRKADMKTRNGPMDFDDIKGTGGKSQNADAIILVRKKKGNQMELKCSSKDADEPINILLNVSEKGSDQEKFTIEADLSDATANKSKQHSNQFERKVFQLIPRDGLIANGELVRHLNSNPTAVRRALEVQTENHLCAIIQVG